MTNTINNNIMLNVLISGRFGDRLKEKKNALLITKY